MTQGQDAVGQRQRLSQALFRDSLVHLVREHAAAVLLVSHELGAVADNDRDALFAAVMRHRLKHVVLRLPIEKIGPRYILAGAPGARLALRSDEWP